ncbi:helix-turn-helix domain-containing protein [Rhodococcus globerulus]|uniref:TetR/AcrR family transcriptional regulator n=1 Tax=Rhodococcus globerulus TaxID=33008 RepID=UPI0030161E5E
MHRLLRADAVRNRQLILDAARALFAEKGIGVTLDDVAHRAGVGVGTVYRRFANKELLIDAAFRQDFVDMVAATDAALSNPDPWTGLADFMKFSCRRMSTNRGLKDVLSGTDEGRELVARQRSIIEPAVERIFDRARAAGALRSDLVLTDLVSLLFMVGAAVEFAQPVNSTVWQRYLAVILNGMRAHESFCDVLQVPPLTSQELCEARRLHRVRR